jgi:hypothetical protein
METEAIFKRVGLALIAAGHALHGPATTKKVETPKTEEVEAKTEEVEAKTEEAPKKKKRKRRTKAEIEAEKKAKEESEDDFEDIAPDEVVQEPALDQDKLKSALVAYAKKTSKDQAFGILAKFGAKKVADLDPKHYQEVYEKVAVNA